MSNESNCQDRRMMATAGHRAEPSGIHLTEEDAATVKGMLIRGDRQHDIAAWFGVNGGRITEIATGKRFAEVEAQASNLPPAGPYHSGRRSAEMERALEDALGALSTARKALHSMMHIRG